MTYVPSRGDLIWLNFSSQTGHEQKGKRLAIVITPKNYNHKTSLAICCPITSHQKDYPFEVLIEGKKISGVALADHLKSLDWRARKAKFIEKANPKVTAKCMEKAMTLFLKDGHNR